MDEKKKVQKFRIVLTRADDGGFTVEVPRLPGCVSHGRTLQEAAKNAKQAILLHLENLAAHGEPIPDEEDEP